MAYRTGEGDARCAVSVPRTKEIRRAEHFVADWHDEPEPLSSGYVVDEVIVETPELDGSGEPITRPCGGAAVARCLRCDAPLCATHTPPPDRRCDDCERQLDPVAAGRTEHLVVGISAGAGCIAALVLSMMGRWWMAAAVVLGALSIIGAVGPLVQRARRRRFLSERQAREDAQPT